MGCNQSTQTHEPYKVTSTSSKAVRTSNNPSSSNSSSRNNFLITMIGNTSVSGMVLGFTSHSFEPIICKIAIPRYCNALLHDQDTGYITGGIQDLQSNINSKATIDSQIIQGVISKKFIKVNMKVLMADPASSFEVLPDMVNARYAHCAIQMGSYLYVIGGRQYGSDQSGLLSACQKYDFSAKKWKGIPALQNPRSAACALTYGEHLYVFGGYSGNNARTKVIQSYSDGDSGWRKLPYNLPQGLEGALLIKKPSTQSSIYVFGGKNNYQKSNRIFQINFDKSTINYCGLMKEARCFHKGRLVGNQVFLIGGGTQYIQTYFIEEATSQLNHELTYLEFCTMKQLNSFSQFQSQIHLNYKKKPAIPSAFQNKVYIYGHSYQPFSKIINTDNLVVMSDGQSLMHSFYQFTTVLKVNKQYTFVMGGLSSDFSQVTNIVYSFNMKTQEIKYLDPMLTARYAFSACVKGSHLYVLGGRKIGDDDSSILNQCQRFSFQTYKWQSIPSMKYKRQSCISALASNYIIAIGGYKGNGARMNQMQIYIQEESRWIQLDSRFELSVQSMYPVHYNNGIYLFGGRAESTDIQKVFKLNLNVDEGLKYEKMVSVELEPVGNLSMAGTNLKVFVNNDGIAYVFGNIECGVDIYDLKKHKVLQTEQLAVFGKLSDKLFQSYTLIF